MVLAASVGMRNAAAAPPAPNAGPQGGVVVGGAVTIANPNAQNTTVTQGTQRGAVDWQSFNVGAQHTVTFNQPSSKAITLNKVVGPDPSQIAGKITANGQIVLMNQSGVAFSEGSQVNAAGLVVTTSGISAENTRKFIAGGSLAMDQAPKPGAQIVNEGNLTVAEGGLAALVAPSVANKGGIRAKLGKVILAGGEKHTIDLYGDGLLSIDVTQQVHQATVGPDGKPVTALVTNTGTIVADGGTVLLTAKAVDGIVQTLVSAGGTIQANSVGARTGTVVVQGRGGDVRVDGKISVAGASAGEKGGQVAVNATGTVTIGSAARIDASGQAGGGVVALGTTLARAKGGASVTPKLTAAKTTIEAGSRISADATVKGDGGKVTVLSTQSTQMAGAISAKGAGPGGNGGFAEVSGASGFSLTGTVDLAAPGGQVGTLLIDPYDLVLSNSQPVGSMPITVPAPSGGTSTVLATDPPPDSMAWLDLAVLNASSANVVLQTAHDLSLVYTLGQANAVSLGANALTLQAGNNLSVDRGITISASALTLASGYNFPTSMASNAGGILLGSTIGAPAGTAPTTIHASTVTLLGGTGGVSLTDSVIGSALTPASTLDVNSTAGGVSQSAGGAIYANTLTSTSSGGVGGALNLIGLNNQIQTLQALKAGTDFTLNDSGSLTVATGVVIGGTANTGIAANGTLTVNGAVTGAHVDLRAGDIVVDGSVTASGIPLASVLLTTVDPLANVTASYFGPGAPSLSPGAGTVTLGTAATVSATGIIAGKIGTSLVNEGTIQTTDPILGRIVFIAGGDISETNKSATIDTANFAALAGSTFAGTKSASGGSIDLVGGTGANKINTLGTISAWSADGLSGGNIDILVSPPGSTLTLANNITADGILRLISSSGVTQHAGTTISAGRAGSGATPAIDLVATGGDFLQANTAGIQATAAGGWARIQASGSLQLAGGVQTDATTGQVSLISGTTIMQTGTLTTGLLTGSAVGSTSLIGATPASNQIAGLGSFTADGFSLNDGAALSVSGALHGGASATLADSSGLTVSGSVGAGAISLTGTSLTIQGTVSDGGAGTVALFATGGGITESGTLVAGTLSGSSTDAASLGQASNKVATLAGFTVSSGNFALADGAALTVTGAVQVTSGNTLSFAADHFTIGALGTISAPGGQVELGPLTSGQNLTVGSTTFAQISAESIRIGQSIPGGSIRAASIDFDGNVIFSGTLDVVASGSVTQSAGFLNVGALSGSSNGASFVQAGNTIPVINGYDAGIGLFAVHDQSALVVTGSVLGSGIQLATNAGLTLSGVLSAGGAGTVDLSATSVIQTSGRVVAGSLISTSGVSGSVLLTQAANQVAGLGSFTTKTGFTLVDGQALTVSGAVSDGHSVVLSDAGFALVVASGGSVSAPVVSLTGDSLNIAGSVTGPTSVGLNAGAGGITESGTVMSGSLSGSSVGDVSLAQASNKIATLAGFTVSSGSFLLADASALTVSSPLQVGSGKTLSFAVDDFTIGAAGMLVAPSGLVELGPLTIGHSLAVGSSSLGLIAASTVRFGQSIAGGGVKAASIDVAGNVTSAGTLDLVASGPITQSAGVLNVAALSGSSNGADFSQAGNNIAVLGNFDVGSGTFALRDLSDLSVNGNISGSGIRLTTGATLHLSGGLNAGASGTVDLSAADVMQTAGQIIAGSLISSGGVSGGVSLTQVNNQIASLGKFTTTTGFALDDTQSLVVNGGISDSQFVTLRDHGFALTVATGNSVTAPVVTLSGDSLNIAGSVNGPTSVALGATHTIDIPGSFNGGAVSMNAGTGITETGSVTAATLSGSAGSASFNGTNHIASLDTFATKTGLALTDSQALTVVGAVSDNASVTLNDAGFALAVGAGASVVAPSVSLISSSINVTGNVTGPASVSLNSAGTIDIRGSVSGGDVTTTAGSNITEPGSLTAATLTGSAGSAELTGANQIASVGNFSTGTDFTLTDGRSLTVIGTVTGNNVTFGVNGNMTDNGALQASAIAASASGGISVGGLAQGTSSVVLSAGNGIDVPGTVAGGTIALNAGSAVSVSGNLSGSTIDATGGNSFGEYGASITAATIRATAPTLSLNGGSILTGSTPVPGGTLTPGQIPDGSGQGLYLSADYLTQSGTTRVNGNGADGSIRVGARAGGAAVNANFNDLQAASSKLFLVLGSGSASGAITTQGLEVAYSGSGGTSLSGSVNGRSGSAAATASFITPAVSGDYRINGCEIASAICTVGLAIRPPAVFLLTDLGFLQFASSSSSGSSLGSSSGGARSATFSIFPVTDTGFDSSSDQDSNLDDLLPDIADRDF